LKLACEQVISFPMNRPLLILALSAAIILWSLYQSLGGVEGIQRDPARSLSVVGIVVLISAPFFWFRYRRLQREPIYEAVRDPEPTAPSDVRLDNTPIVFVASRPKILALLLLSVVAFSVAALIFWTQPGVCRVLGLATIAPVFAFTLAMAVVSLAVLERLEITREGLKHSTFWRSRFWPWDEIRDLTLIKARAFGRSWTSGIVFNRFSADPYASGPARIGLRPTWPLASEKLADLVNQARLRWSSPTASEFFPVRKGVLHYLPAALTWLFMGLMLYALIERPCA
jgi:hypothetical protein